MKITPPYSPKGYLSEFRSRLDSRLMFGQERFIGRTAGRLFSVQYFSGQEIRRRRNPILNKAVGFVKAADSGCTVVYYNFRGMTDPASVALLFLTCLLVGMLTKLPLPGLIAAGWTALVAGYTWFCTWLTESGQEGKDQLDEFLLMK